MKQEDIASGFVALVTLVLNILPSVTATPGLLTPAEDAALISLAVFLKAILGDITIGQPKTLEQVSADIAASEKGTWAVTATQPNGQPYTGTLSITTTKAEATANLAALGFTNIVIGAKLS